MLLLLWADREHGALDGCWDCGAQGATPLHTAAAHSSFQAHAVVADLLAAGADVEAADGEGRTPLLLALASNRKDAIDALLNAGARRPLHAAEA
jgi:ankyrin repeat protein